MSGQVSFLDSNGKPMEPPRRRALSLTGGGNAPYDASDIWGEHTAAWRPYLWSPDGELNPWRDRIVSRVRDMVRNDGWAAGSITRILDNAIGSNFRPIAKPDYRALAAHSGNPAFDAKWADEYGRAAEALWRSWSNDPGRYCDAGRKLSVSQIFRLAFRHKLVDGDALALMLWLPERMGKGRGRYATTIQLIDPDRLSNPQLAFDNQIMRGGVEIDRYGAAQAYHIRKAHQGDWWSAAESMEWERVPRETSWGRPIIIHDFDHDRADQHRGGAGVLSPVLIRLKMLAKYDSTELDAAILNAIFGAFIQSPYDPQMVQEAIDGGDGSQLELGEYQSLRADFHDQHKIALGGVRMPILAPGESVNTVTATRPNSNFSDFEAAVLRNAASAIGISAQQLSNNWSDVNYSSARAALLESWKTLTRRRDDFAAGFASPIYGCFIEESMGNGELPLPDGVVPDYIECRSSYSACRWMGPGRGWVDPVAEKQGALLGMQAGLSTLEMECAEQGLDYEDLLDQRAAEIARYKTLGIPLPPWALGAEANEVSKKPEAE